MAPPLRSSRGTLAMMFVAMMALTPLVQAKIIIPQNTTIHRRMMFGVDSDYKDGSSKYECTGSGTEVKVTFYKDEKCEDKDNAYTRGWGGTFSQPDCCEEYCYAEHFFCVNGVPTVGIYREQGLGSDCDGKYYSSALPWGEDCITWEAEMAAYGLTEMNEYGSGWMDANCGDSCEVEFPYTRYDACKYFEKIGPTGCMSDCRGDDKALLNGLMKRCGLNEVAGSAETVKFTFVLVAGLASVLLSL